jgi:hypothetical protein
VPCTGICQKFCDVENEGVLVFKLLQIATQSKKAQTLWVRALG